MYATIFRLLPQTRLYYETEITNSHSYCLQNVYMYYHMHIAEYDSDYNILYYAVGSQMWLLCRILPCMIGDSVLPQDRKWKNYILLLKIMTYLFSPYISEEDCSYLGVGTQFLYNMYIKSILSTLIYVFIKAPWPGRT